MMSPAASTFLAVLCTVAVLSGVSAQGGIGGLSPSPVQSPGALGIAPSPSPSPSPTPHVPGPSPSPPPPPSFIPTPGGPIEPPGPVVFTLLHASDAQINAESVNYVANWAGLVQFFTSARPFSSAYMSGGSNWQNGPGYRAGSAVEQQIQNAWGNNNLEGGPGRADLTIQTVAGLRASVLGAGEFDAGVDSLRSIISAQGSDWLGAQFPYLGLNLDFSWSSLSDIATQNVLPSTSFQTTAFGANFKLASVTYVRTRDNHVYGVVGLSSGDLLYQTRSEPVWTTNSEYSQDMQAVAGLVQPQVYRLLQLGINKVILLANIGDFILAQELANYLIGVDIIVAGGAAPFSNKLVQSTSTDFLWPGDERYVRYPTVEIAASGAPTLVVWTPGNYKYLGVLNVQFGPTGIVMGSSGEVYGATDDTLDLLGVSRSSPEYLAVSNLANGIKQSFNSIAARVDGHTDTFVNGDFPDVRVEETNMGDLQADALLWAVGGRDFADVALVSSGGIGGSYNEGNINSLDVQFSSPDNYPVSILEITASSLYRELENAVADYLPSNVTEYERPSFVQVSGLFVRYNIGLNPYSRVTDLYLLNEKGKVSDIIVFDQEFRGEPLRTLKVATTSFLADGHNGYTFPISSIVRTDVEGGGLSDIISRYLREFYLDENFDEDEPKGRIVIVNDPSEASASALSISSLFVAFAVAYNALFQ